MIISILLFIILFVVIIFVIIFGVGASFLSGLFRGKRNDAPKAKEGEVYLSRDDIGQKDKVVDKHIGEYVDYEPVNDEK